MNPVKQSAGGLMAALNRQCRFTRACFLIGHMRCGSTALSAILTGTGQVSGYGEAHIAYTGRASLGLLAINQWRRGAWNRQATGLFDKILHNRYDGNPPSDFFAARAVFMAREPIAAITSIRALFATIGSREYASDEAAANYYCERLEAMLRSWAAFGARRIAICYEDLIREPETQLARISATLALVPPLANHYTLQAAAQARGGGDPINAGKHRRIVAMPARAAAAEPALPPDLLARANDRYAQFKSLAGE